MGLRDRVDLVISVAECSSETPPTGGVSVSVGQLSFGCVHPEIPDADGGRPKLRRNSAAGSGFAAVEVFCCQYRVDKIQEETDK